MCDYETVSGCLNAGIKAFWYTKYISLKKFLIINFRYKIKCS